MEPQTDCTAVRDTVIRLALVLMAKDPRSPLLPKQRDWIHGLAKRKEAFTDMQRGRIALHLLPWFLERWPRVYAIVAEQFDDVVRERAETLWRGRRSDQAVSHDL